MQDSYSTEDKKQVALKITRKKEHSLGFLKLMSLPAKYCKPALEIDVLRAVRHNHIVELIDNFEYLDKCGQKWDVIALNLCSGGSLAEYRQATFISEHIARYFFAHIVQAVNKLHMAGFAHMDLRLENVLLDNLGEPRICDFGNALKFVKVSSGTGLLSMMSNITPREPVKLEALMEQSE